MAPLRCRGYSQKTALNSKLPGTGVKSSQPAVLAGAFVGFLLFNYNRAKIFMGHTGSMAIGFIIAILAVRFVEANRVKLMTIPFPLVNAPAMAFAVLSVPLFDMIRVFGVRLIQKNLPFLQIEITSITTL